MTTDIPALIAQLTSLSNALGGDDGDTVLEAATVLEAMQARETAARIETWEKAAGIADQKYRHWLADSALPHSAQLANGALLVADAIRAAAEKEKAQ